jgi:heme-degrading monooxygenase HmoA
MYGTVAQVKVKPGKAKDLAEYFRSEKNHSAGFEGLYVYQMDDDPDTMWMVVMFESKAAYEANAHDPEQNKRFEVFQGFFAGEPQWHDGEILVANKK